MSLEQVKLQSIVTDRVAKQKANAVERDFDPQELNPDMAQPFSAPSVHFVNDPPQEGEEKFMLASVPKIGIMLALAEVITDLPPQPATVEIIIELNDREPTRLDRSPYADLPGGIKEKFALIRQLREEKGEEAAEKLKDASAQVRTDIERYLETKDVLLTKEELTYLVLTLSSNAATQLVKRLATDDVMQAKLASLAPHYEQLVTTKGLAHWTQLAPNVGTISDFSKLLDDLVRKRSEGGLSPEEEVILESMVNNATDFGFDFTHTELGQDLMKRGWQVAEKTGYYPCVFWVKDSADKGWPMHMVLATVVSCYNPKTKQWISFDHHMLIAVATPRSEEIYVEGVGKIECPNEWGKEYAAYAQQVKQRYSEIFRAECEAAMRKRRES